MSKRKTIVKLADRTVEVIQQGDQVGSTRLEIEGLEVEMEILPLPGGGYSVRQPDGQMTRVDVCEDREGLTLSVGGVRHQVHPMDERDTWLKGRGGGPRDDGGILTVSMPGKVVKVLKAEGDTVAVGDGVLIIEAMKMENEVRVSRDGVISQVCVSVGDSVEAGQPLVRIHVAEGGDNV
jgi:biotin carboxyl carrier protein